MINKLLHWSSRLIIPVIFFSILQFLPSSLYGQEKIHNADTILIAHAESNEIAAQNQEESHSGDMSPLFFLILAILLVLLPDIFLKRSLFPILFYFL